MAVEHLLYALLHDEATAKVIRKAGGKSDKLKRRLERILTDDFSAVAGDDPVQPTPTRGFQRVLQRAAIHVQSSGKDELKGHNVLVAIFAEADSPAVQAMGDSGVTRYDVVSFISHGVTKDEGDESLEATPGVTETDDEEREPGGDPLERFAVNLNDRAAAGEIETLVGREKELRRAIQ